MSQVRVTRRIGKAYTSYNVFEGINRAVLLVHVVQTWYLDQPADVVRIELVFDDPFGELVPFVKFPAVDTDSPFTVLAFRENAILPGGRRRTYLVLALLEIRHDL